MKRQRVMVSSALSQRRLLFIFCCILAIASWVSAQTAVDPDLKAETHKSAFQRRREANQRLMGTVQGQQALEAAKAESAKNANKAAAAPKAPAAMASTPTGINPAVDVNLPNFANSPNIRKFVDSLPGLGPANMNNLQNYVSVGVPDINAYPGSDYYEIALVRFGYKMNSDLPPTDTRGYVQLETPANAATSQHIALTYPDGTPILNAAGQQVYAYEPPMYMGPVIVAQKSRPVRIKFTNYLPKGAAGNLPLPVDTTVMGAGMGPLPMPGMPGMMESYTQNRATLHLHGGLTPWISDGTPHQWTVPRGETTQYPKGASVGNPSDMPDPGPGSINFYYTNEQSARLMFYHDHAYGITRLNVYAGEAAGYLISDPVEQDLIKGTNNTGGNPGNLQLLPTLNNTYPLGIPLVIQDRTFVNTAATPPGPGFPANATPTTLTANVDPLWFKYVPNSVGGNLWFPHEYMPNENIYDYVKGYNDMGRWDYGPWMIPPMQVLNNTLPSPTIVPEAFMDTMIVNGTAFPYVELPPSLVRFRILNACNDRMLNLQLYKVDPLHPTEVKMVDAAPNPAYPATWPKDGRDGGVPDPALMGPDIWQIGNECGFLAQLNIVPAQPVDFDYNRRSVTFGGVTSKALLLPPAVRADVIVDLSKYIPGDTLILYNDAPAPMPLYDTRYDYYTGDPDQTAIGGAPTTQEGFGPNTRTVMQIRIKGTGTPPPANYLATLQAALPLAYAKAQEPPVVPEPVFNAAYGANYPQIFASAVDESLNVSGQPQSLAKIIVELPGQNYTTPPNVGIYGGGGTGASAVASLNGVTGITVVTAGSGYTSLPTVTITPAPGDTGTGATAVASISGGVVTAITVTNPGSNYLLAPTVTLAGGGAVTQATAQANIVLGSVGAITITNTGSGYTSPPRVYLTGGGGTGAVAVAMLNGSMAFTGKNLVEGMDMEYGRMNAILGSTPNALTPTVGAGVTIGGSYYIDPPTELLDAEQPVLWRITHIGVDSHSIHVHLFDLQVINRVDWTNTLKPPYPDEIGWKETIRTNPFEDIIVALRPTASKMKLPFGLPDSNRLLDVTMPAGSTGNFTPNLAGGGIPAVAQITNVMTNFGWEYVWHCHLLGHEENDMMRPIVFNVPRTLPAAPVLSVNSSGQANLTWTDGTPVSAPTTPGNPANEIGYMIQRGLGTTGALTPLTTALANATTYGDTAAAIGSTYRYQVIAYNAAGNSPSNIVTATVTLPAPSNLTAAISAQAPLSINLNWKDNTTLNSGFICQRATNAAFTTGLVSYTLTPGTLTSWSNTTNLAANTTYYYRIRSTMGGVNSTWSNTASVSTAVPAAPTNLAAVMSGTAVWLTWVDNATNEGGCSIQRANNTAFTVGLTQFDLTGAGITSYSDTTAALGTQYYYRTRAFNAAGNSGWSNVAPILTPTVQTVPGAPTSVSASPGDRQAIVSFSPPASDGGSAITRYTASATDGTNTFTAFGPASPLVIPGLTNGVTYAVTVTATNFYGTGPASSPAVNVIPALPPPSPVVDVNVSTDKATWTATVASPAFSTAAANELLLAFIATDATPTGTNNSVSAVTGGTGLTWTLAIRTNTQRGTSEIWYAFAPAIQANITVTASLVQTAPAMLTVMSFTGVDTTGNGAGAIGATGTGNSSRGAPTASLVTTRNNSLVLGVGNDWSGATTHTVGAGQTMVHQYLCPVGDTFWVQQMTVSTPLAGTTVTINDTAPTIDQYNLSIIEVRTP